jgi:hypothetical protein
LVLLKREILRQSSRAFWQRDHIRKEGRLGAHSEESRSALADAIMRLILARNFNENAVAAGTVNDDAFR